MTMYTQYLTMMLIFTFIKVKSLPIHKPKKTQVPFKQNVWIPSNIDEWQGFNEYMNSRQVKEQSPFMYNKLKKERKLERYINKPYKPNK